jgi:hypothetical protein
MTLFLMSVVLASPLCSGAKLVPASSTTYDP